MSVRTALLYRAQLCGKLSRGYSHRALSTRPAAPIRDKVTILEILKKKKKEQPISMVTAYDYPSACHVDMAGIDILLIGDSVAMVELGHDTTQAVTVDQMLYHCQSVSRGASRPLLVGDMPFGSYENNKEVAYDNAVRFIKEGGVDTVKLEGGLERAETVHHIVQGGVAVMAHIGLMPQRISVLGGFRAQGRNNRAAQEIVRAAVELERAGAYAIVIECVPPQVALAVTEAVSIPTIGIGSGKYTSGQVLVYHDLLGMFQHAHHAKVTPSFCKKFGAVGDHIQLALNQYREEVDNATFPGDQFAPFTIPDKELVEFQKWYGTEHAEAAEKMHKKAPDKLQKKKKKKTEQSIDQQATDDVESPSMCAECGSTAVFNFCAHCGARAR
eukprot:g28553.t1